MVKQYKWNVINVSVYALLFGTMMAERLVPSLSTTHQCLNDTNSGVLQVMLCQVSLQMRGAVQYTTR